MGRINVTVLIFAGALVPNFTMSRGSVQEGPRTQQGSRSRTRQADGAHVTQHDATAHNFSQARSKSSKASPLVTVLAQDHCYSDLLRFVPTTNSLLRSAMIRERCPFSMILTCFEAVEDA